MLTNSLSRLSEYSWSRAYEPNPALENSRAARLAYLLFLLDLVFMIRGFALSNIIELILFSLFIFSPTLRLEFLKAIKDRAVFFLAIFYLWVFLSGFWSTAVWMDILHNWLGWRKILLVPIGFVVLNSRKKAQTACYTLLLMGVVYLTVALVDLFGFGALWGRPYHSVAQDANVQGLYFTIAGSYFILMGWTRRSPLLLTATSVAVGLLFYVFVAFFGISRSGYVAFIIAIGGLGLYLSKGKWVIGLVTSMTIALVCLIFSVTAQNRVHQAVSELAVGAEGWGGTHTSGSIRYVMWANTLEVITKHPLIGTGAGGFQQSYSEVVADTLGWRGIETEDPHNHYLHVFSQYGLIGFALFCLYQFMLGVRIFSGGLNACVLGVALVSISAIGLFNGIFGAFAMGRLSFLALTIFAVLCAFDRRELGLSRES